MCGNEVKVPHRVKDNVSKKEIHVCSTCWTDAHIIYLGEFKKK